MSESSKFIGGDEEAQTILIMLGEQGSTSEQKRPGPSPFRKHLLCLAGPDCDKYPLIKDKAVEKVQGRVWLVQVNDGSGWWTFGKYVSRNAAENALHRHLEGFPNDGGRVIPDDSGQWSAYEVHKDLSASSELSGGALVPSPKFGKRIKSPQLNGSSFRGRKSFHWLRKDTRGSCEQGETAAQTGCIPAEGGGGKKPTGEAPPEKKPKKEKKPEKRAAPGSQMDEGTKTKLREMGMSGTFPPAEVPIEDIKVADLSLGAEELKYQALISWNQKTKSGRTSGQYRYTQEFHDRNAEEKFDRISVIEPFIGKITEVLKEKMGDDELSTKEQEAAAIASMIRETGLRPTDGDESVKHGHFGISSLQARHVKVVGDKIKLNFIGKEGVRNKTEITDPDNIAFIKSALEGKGSKDFLFQEATSGHALTILKAVSKDMKGPKDILLKDLRTIKATEKAREIVASFKGPPPPLSGNEKKDAKLIAKTIMAMSGEVAKVLNNTAIQARNNYIHPEVFREWQSKLSAKS